MHGWQVRPYPADTGTRLHVTGQPSFDEEVVIGWDH
jgi:hypothetical protein